MFNSVELIRSICKQRKIPIAKLEKDCGFANGYLNPKKLSKLPYDRAVAIGEYLGIPVEYILTGVDTKKAPTENGERNLIKIAGRNGSYQERYLTDDQLAVLKALLDQLPKAPDDL